MAVSADPSLRVLAWGNESRGDDGVGPYIASRLRDLGRNDIEITEDFQLQIEHVMDLRGSAPVLFVDAGVGIEPGFRLEKLVPLLDSSISTHAVSPQGLLGLFEQTLSEEAPDAYLLQIHGADFELGTELSEATRGYADSAWQFLESLLNEPAGTWQQRLDETAVA